MVKPLTFKGDKKPKKRKRTEATEGAGQDDDPGRKQVKAAKAAADADEAENDDSWVSADAVTDVSGPVMFVLPTEPPTALACDANGKVFTLPVENIVDGNPSTAEPHDVRQVWVANRIAGTEHFRFKGHHGKYVHNCPSVFCSASADLSLYAAKLTVACKDTYPAPKSASSPPPRTPSPRSNHST
jgi:protein FRG1